MKKYRYTALGLGSVFSALYLGLAGTDLELFHYATPLDLLLVSCGPLSLIFATLLGWLRQEKAAAWWLLGGSVTTTALVLLRFASALMDAPSLWLVPILVVLALLALPMLVCGLLLRKSVQAGRPRPNVKARAEEALCPFTYKRSLHEN